MPSLAGAPFTEAVPAKTWGVTSVRRSGGDGRRVARGVAVGTGVGVGVGIGVAVGTGVGVG
ncbi:MAG: hypothetical protein COB68_14375 [SAR202 cluster bacterium]|nr:MAG: hypothetical protein COB68_14375 [SAR202 cluster bacterium]